MTGTTSDPRREFFEAVQRVHREAGAPASADIAAALGTSGIDAAAVDGTLHGPAIAPWDVVALVFAALQQLAPQPSPHRDAWLSALYQLWSRAASAQSAAAPAPSPAPAAPSAPRCPMHGTDQMVRLVSGVYSEGRAHTSSWGPVVGSASGHLVVGTSRQSGTVETLLAARLSPVQKTNKGAGLIIAAFVIAAVGSIPGLGLYASAASTEHPAGTREAAAGYLGFIGLIVAGLFAAAIAQSNRSARIDRGMARAYPYWQAAWYCLQCDGVFFPSGRQPPGAPADTLLTPESFQYTLRVAGGLITPPAPPAGRPDPATRGKRSGSRRQRIGRSSGRSVRR